MNVLLRNIATIIILFLLFVINANSTDTIPTKTSIRDSIINNQLQELVVTGINTKIIKDGLSFIPSKNTKNHSSDAYSLLQKMSIPLLQVTPNKVTTFDGSNISFFINFIPASENDCKNLLPSDVLRVEYLKNPGDSRFAGARTVINFILREYECGGYVRLQPTQYFSPIKGDYSIYSKINYRRMTFDLSTHADYYNFKNVGSETISLYRDLEFNDFNFDGYSELKRIERLSGNDRESSCSAALRVLYQSDKLNFYNTLGYNFQNSPTSSLIGKVQYTPAIYTSEIAKSKSNFRKSSANWEGYYLFRPDKKHTLLIMPKFLYGHLNRRNSFIANDITDINHSYVEDAYTPIIFMQYAININKYNGIALYLNSRISIYSTLYSGTIPDDMKSRQTLQYGNHNFLIKFIHGFKNRINLSLCPSINYLYNIVNGVETINHFSPAGEIAFNFPVSMKDFLSANIKYSQDNPNEYYTNSVLRQVNEIDWVKGNPELGCMSIIRTNISYTHTFSNKISTNIGFNYRNEFNVSIPYYTPRDNVMLTQYKADGILRRYEFYLSAPLRLLSNSLLISPSAKITKFNQTGGSNHKGIAYNVNISTSYTWKDFDIRVYYMNGQRYAVQQKIVFLPSQYGIVFGFSKSSFHGEFSLRNLFRKLKADSYIINTKYFSQNYQYYRQGAFTRFVELVLSYTINFGRKIKENSEISGSLESPSSIGTGK